MEDAAAEVRKKKRTGLTVSDLHLFSDYTQTKQLLPLLDDAIERTKADLVVFNGDIFEFEHPKPKFSQKKVATKSIEWLEKFSKKHPNLQVHYVMGNHDGVFCPEGEEYSEKKDFPRRLRALERELPNFHFYPEYYLAAENALFTHGDIPMRGRDISCGRIYDDIDEARRTPHVKDILTRHMLSTPPSINLPRFIEEIFYRVPELHRLGQLVADFHNRHGRINPTVARNVAGAVGKEHDIYHVFTGHTHIPRDNDLCSVRLAGPDGKMYRQQFLMHNTGSSVRSYEFNMLEFDLEDTVISNQQGKNDVRTLVTGVRRAEELVQLPLGWKDKMKLMAINTGYAFPH